MKAKIIVKKSEQDVIIDGLRKYGRSAYNATLANGIPATVLKGKNICRIEPNGDVSVVAKMDQQMIKITHKTFRLK